MDFADWRKGKTKKKKQEEMGVKMKVTSQAQRLMYQRAENKERTTVPH